MIVALVENKLQRSINDYHQNNNYRVKVTNEAAEVKGCWVKNIVEDKLLESVNRYAVLIK